MREKYIDGNVCDVRENLSWALYHLRLTDRPRIFWIDALCINQEDTKERNHQAGQMDRIYRDAKLVAVYVGRETEEDAQAMEYISKSIMNAFTSKNSSAKDIARSSGSKY